MIVDELIALLGYDVEGSEKLQGWLKSLDKAASQARTFATVVGGAAAAAGAAFVAGISALAPSVLKVSGEFERYETQLTTLEGSAEKAKASMDWVAEFARTTPYDLAGVTAAFVKLKAYGLDPMDGTLKSMGDWGAAMGKSLDQVVEAVADATTMEFERLKELGLRAKQDKNSVTFSWTEAGKAMTATTEKTGEAINKFLNEYAGRRFGGSMENLAKTWEGILDKVGDTWQTFLKKIGDAGFFEAMKERLSTIFNTIDDWFESGRIDRIAKVISDSLVWLVDMVGAIIDRIVTHLTFLMDNLSKVEPYFKGIAIAIGLALAAFAPWGAVLLAAGFAIDDLLTYLEGGDSIIGDFLESLKGMEWVLYAVGAAAAAAFAYFLPGIAAVLALGVAIGDLYAYFTGGESYIGSFIEWVKSLGSIVYWVGGALGVLLVAFAPVTAAVLGLIAVVADLWQYFAGGESHIGDLLSWFQGLGSSIASIASTLFQPIVDAWNSLSAWASSAISSLSEAFASGGASGVGAKLAQMLMDGFASAWSTLAHAIYDLIVGAVSAVVNFDWNGLATRIVTSIAFGLLSQIAFMYDFFVKAAELIMSVDWIGLAARVIAALAAAFMAFVDFLAGFWAEVGNRAVAWAQSLGPRLVAAIKEAFAGLGSWIADQIPEIKLPGFLGGKTIIGGGGSTPPPSSPAPASPPVTPTLPNTAANNQLTRDQLASAMKNLQGNVAKTGDTTQNVSNVMTDNRQDNREFPVTVNAPISMNVQQATQAPAAVASGVQTAVNRGVQANPARMQSGPAMP